MRLRFNPQGAQLTPSPTTACDLCGGQHYKTISLKDRNGGALTSVLCQGCGLVMHMPVPGEADIAEYYAARYRHDYHGEKTPSDRRIMRAWKNGERIYHHLSTHIDSKARIFEIGAGIGCTVKMFETHGHQASGIEPNRDFNAFTRQQLHADVANKNLFDLKPGAIADLVLLIHVIEHFTSPARALNHIHKLLPDNGMLYIECPNLAAPFATFGRLFHFAHIYNFTPATLKAMAEKCGFAPVQSFTGMLDPDIQMLFRKAGAKPVKPDPAEADRVFQAVHRYNWLSYHLRGSYLSRRLAKLKDYALEALLARRFVHRLIAGLSGPKG
jgi:SAM-dependent methyltransferase